MNKRIISENKLDPIDCIWWRKYEKWKINEIHNHLNIQSLNAVLKTPRLYNELRLILVEVYLFTENFNFYED